LIAGNNSNKVKDQDISDDLCNWSNPKNSKSRSRRFSADDVPTVKLRNRFNLLDVDLQSTGFLKHVKDKVKSLVWEIKSLRRMILLLVSSLLSPVHLLLICLS